MENGGTRFRFIKMPQPPRAAFPTFLYSLILSSSARYCQSVLQIFLEIEPPQGILEMPRTSGKRIPAVVTLSEMHVVLTGGPGEGGTEKGREPAAAPNSLAGILDYFLFNCALHKYYRYSAGRFFHPESRPVSAENRRLRFSANPGGSALRGGRIFRARQSITAALFPCRHSKRAAGKPVARTRHGCVLKQAESRRLFHAPCCGRAEEKRCGLHPNGG